MSGPFGPLYCRIEVTQCIRIGYIQFTERKSRATSTRSAFLNRQEYQIQITKSLTWLSAEVSHSNAMNFTDINVHSENFYRDLLNLAFEYGLININILEPNSAAIDLGDIGDSIAIQVTSTSSLDKTKKTVKAFSKKKLYNQYDRLVILNIVKKSNHTAPKIGDDGYELDTKKDIWDVGDLLKRFNDLPTNKLKEICEFLNDELYMQPASALPNEVQTILGLIELISDVEHPDAGDGYLAEPFPEDKIYKRFSDHATFLENRFNDLYSEYGAVLSAVQVESDFNQVHLRRAARHLQAYSDQVLAKNDNDPQIALQAIIDHFAALLGNKGYSFDASAAEFYVIDQLIRCNVFPMKSEPND